MVLFAAVACGSSEPSGVLTGYVEAELRYVATPDSGWLLEVAPREGTHVKRGDLLFVLDQERQEALAQEASARVRQAAAQVADLSKGARRAEIAALQAQLAEAEAAQRFAAAQARRWRQLADTGGASVERADGAEVDAETSAARVRTLRANLRAARLGGRDDARTAAQASLEAAEAAVAKAEWGLAQRTVHARLDGRVEHVFHRRGEFVPIGTPVLAILPRDALKVRFFIPEVRLSEVTLGMPVTVRMDGREGPLSGTVSHIAHEAEFTPPVLYSTTARQRLVYLVEARITHPEALRPGQPVDVALEP